MAEKDTFHLLYKSKTGKLKSKLKKFNSLNDAEKYLKKIKASYWEIGVDDDKFLKSIGMFM